jgi:hypothetical protein
MSWFLTNTTTNVETSPQFRGRVNALTLAVRNSCYGIGVLGGGLVLDTGLSTPASSLFWTGFAQV